MDTASLMWDETGRDLDHEQRELARTAALNDAERTVGQFVYLAADNADLGHRLALAEPHLQAIAATRGYTVDELTGDLTERWQILSTARTAAAQKSAAVRRVTAAQEQAMDAVAARLAAVAARENPAVPMVECLRLATEAVRVHADAYPLAYESWGGAADGPFTDRAKHWKPPGMKGSGGTGATDPGSEGGSSTFDDVHKRLDDMETRLAGPSGPAAPPSGPGGPTTASLQPTVAGFFDRLKDWWHGPTTTPSSTPAPAAAHNAPAPAAEEEAPEHVGPHDPTGWHGNAPARHAEDLADAAAERSHDEAGRREFDDIMHRLNNDQADMRHKFDNPGYNEHRPWRTHISDANRLEQANDSVADNLERRLNEAGAPAYHPTPIQHSLFD
jgi:hypothetical protein